MKPHILFPEVLSMPYLAKPVKKDLTRWMRSRAETMERGAP
jgi:hypothetical protein